MDERFLSEHDDMNTNPCPAVGNLIDNPTFGKGRIKQIRRGGSQLLVHFLKDDCHRWVLFSEIGISPSPSAANPRFPRGRFDVALLDTPIVLPSAQAMQRNDLVAALADAVFVPHATNAGKTWATVSKAVTIGQEVFAPDDEADAGLLACGVKACRSNDLDDVLSPILKADACSTRNVRRGMGDKE